MKIKTNYKILICPETILFLTLIITSCEKVMIKDRVKSLVIQKQGSFAVGGTVISNPGTFNPYAPIPAGQTFHGDHAYIVYQIPEKPRKFPLLFWHGFGQFSKT